MKRAEQGLSNTRLRDMVTSSSKPQKLMPPLGVQHANVGGLPIRTSLDYQALGGATPDTQSRTIEEPRTGPTAEAATLKQSGLPLSLPQSEQIT